MLIISREGAFLPVDCTTPSRLLPWLNYEDSLTERLREKAFEARIEVLNEDWGGPDGWDRQVLHCHNEALFRREILMWAHDEVCWYARTIIPYSTYQNHRALFSRLEKESLGALIFSTPQINRIDMIHYPISDNSIEYYWINPSLHHQTKVLWARLSSFLIADEAPFFLIEILLPGLLRYSN